MSLPALDLNDREKSRFATTLRRLSEQANKAADALEAQPYDEAKFIVQFVMLSLILASLGELGKIVHDAATKDAAPEFPSIIGG